MHLLLAGVLAADHVLDDTLHSRQDGLVMTQEQHVGYLGIKQGVDHDNLEEEITGKNNTEHHKDCVYLKVFPLTIDTLWVALRIGAWAVLAGHSHVWATMMKSSNWKKANVKTNQFNQS